MPKRFIIIGIVIFVLGIIGLSLVFFAIRDNDTESTITTAPPTPAQSSSPCKRFETFEYAQYPINCSYAVDRALQIHPGNIQNISFDQVVATFPLDSGGIETRQVPMWLIDIQLNTPYVENESFGDQKINFLQVGIRAEEDNVIYKKPLR